MGFIPREGWFSLSQSSFNVVLLVSLPVGCQHPSCCNRFLWRDDKLLSLGSSGSTRGLSRSGGVALPTVSQGFHSSPFTEFTPTLRLPAFCCCTFTGVARFPVVSFTHVCSNPVALSLADKERTQLHSSLSLPGWYDVFSGHSLTNIKRPCSERASDIYTVMCGPKCWWRSWNFIQLFKSNIPW